MNESLFFFAVLLLLGLVQLPLFLALDGDFKGAVVVAAAVVAHSGVPPELVHAEGNADHVGVVDLVVVAHP